MVLLGDAAGYAAFLPWPAGRSVVVRAHGDAGPAAAAGADLVTCGGWDPEVTRWDPRTAAPRWSRRPFDGRVTALCGGADAVLVGGADRAAPGDGGAGGDRVDLGPGRVVRIDADGRVSDAVIEATGEVRALACGPGWLALIDDDPAGVLVADDAGSARIPVPRPPATALAARADGCLVADAGTLIVIDVGRRAIRVLCDRGPDPPEALAVVPVGGTVLEATSEGLVRRPDGATLPPVRLQPVGLAPHDRGALVLWPGGLLEERDGSGEVLRSLEVRHGG